MRAAHLPVEMLEGTAVVGRSTVKVVPIPGVLET